MKKINSRRNVLSAVMCMCLAFTLPAANPANADPFGGASITPTAIQEAGMQGGMNQMHDTNYLKDRYQDNYRNEDYQYYQRKKELEENPGSKENQVIQNYNGGSIQQATVEELNTKGVFVSCPF